MKSHLDPSELELVMESVRFFGWLFGAIVTSMVTLMGIYFRLYLKTALQAHSEAIRELAERRYVSKEVFRSELRNLRGTA